MNTILITGTAKSVEITEDNNTISHKVLYDIIFWGSNSGDALQLITITHGEFNGYSDLWDYAKQRAAGYFNNQLMYDGAYTQFLDHIITNQ